MPAWLKKRHPRFFKCHPRLLKTSSPAPTGDLFFEKNPNFEIFITKYCKKTLLLPIFHENNFATYVQRVYILARLRILSGRAGWRTIL